MAKEKDNPNTGKIKERNNKSKVNEGLRFEKTILALTEEIGKDNFILEPKKRDIILIEATKEHKKEYCQPDINFILKNFLDVLFNVDTTTSTRERYKTKEKTADIIDCYYHYKESLHIMVLPNDDYYYKWYGEGSKKAIKEINANNRVIKRINSKVLKTHLDYALKQDDYVALIKFVETLENCSAEDLYKLIEAKFGYKHCYWWKKVRSISTLLTDEQLKKVYEFIKENFNV